MRKLISFHWVEWQDTVPADVLVLHLDNASYTMLDHRES